MDFTVWMIHSWEDFESVPYNPYALNMGTIQQGDYAYYAYIVLIVVVLRVLCA